MSDIQNTLRKKTKMFKHFKTIPFKDRKNIKEFLEQKFGHVTSPLLDSEKTILYYGIPDNRNKYGWRHIATYENGKLRY